MCFRDNHGGIFAVIPPVAPPIRAFSAVAITRPSSVCGPGSAKYVPAPFAAPSDAPPAAAPAVRTAIPDPSFANAAPTPAPAAPETAPTAA
ncbi:hypothetical protein C5C22_15945, partial [Rathayibacter rathayi]